MIINISSHVVAPITFQLPFSSNRRSAMISGRHDSRVAREREYLFSSLRRITIETNGLVVDARYFYASFSNVAPRGHSALFGPLRRSSALFGALRRHAAYLDELVTPPRSNLAKCRAVRKHGTTARVLPSRSVVLRISNDLNILNSTPSLTLYTFFFHSFPLLLQSV